MFCSQAQLLFVAFPTAVETLTVSRRQSQRPPRQEVCAGLVAADSVSLPELSSVGESQIDAGVRQRGVGGEVLITVEKL